MEVAKLLKSYRRLRNLSGAELGRLSGIGQSTVSSIESGNQSPTLDTLIKICNALEVTLVDFLASGSHFPDIPTHDELLVVELYKKLNTDEKNALMILLKSATKGK